MKYRNKDGIELSYEGHENDTSVQLIKEVVKQAIKIGDESMNTRYPMREWRKIKEFLTLNFSITND